MLATALFARLTSVSAVTALVGTRSYPGAGPENPIYPLILYGQINSGAGDARTLTGAAVYFRTLQQIDIYARTRATVEATAKAVRGALDGVEAETMWGGLTIMLSMFDDQFDSAFEADTNLHRIIQQYRITYKEV